MLILCYGIHKLIIFIWSKLNLINHKVWSPYSSADIYNSSQYLLFVMPFIYSGLLNWSWHKPSFFLCFQITYKLIKFFFWKVVFIKSRHCTGPVSHLQALGKAWCPMYGRPQPSLSLRMAPLAILHKNPLTHSFLFTQGLQPANRKLALCEQPGKDIAAITFITMRSKTNFILFIPIAL